MAKITVGFSRPKKWAPFAWLIMTAYGTPYDHVYVKVHSDKYDRDLIYQASSTMVNFMGTEVWNSINVIVAEFALDISDDNFYKMMQFAIDNAGKPYGIKACLGLAWCRLCEICGKKVKNPFADGGKTYVCSELGATILVDFDNFKMDQQLDSVTPLDLYNKMMLLKPSA